MYIWILENKTGITLVFYSSISKLELNQHLVSGLLSALNQFTLSQFDEPIESIEMGGHRWAYILEGSLLFVIAETKDVKAELLRARLNVISQTFIKEYVETGIYDEESWGGHLEKFGPFVDTIRSFYADWYEAEYQAEFAELFDILGVFQQLFISLNKAIRTQLFYDNKVKINEKVYALFEEFKQLDYVKNNEELNKISYNQSTGFDIFTINPLNCDDLKAVEKAMLYLISNYVKIIKEVLGYELALTLFAHAEIFKYFYHNLVMLRDLKLEDFLYQLFLL
ncbi:MAG: hypothetical protein ACTSR8_13015 [Promethearchaeota archaeon]